MMSSHWFALGRVKRVYVPQETAVPPIFRAVLVAKVVASFSSSTPDLGIRDEFAR